MKKILVLTIIAVLGISEVAFASGGTSYTANASPVIVSLSGYTTSASREIVFPYPTRNLYIRNYDSGGVWVNLKGNDTSALTYTANRLYIGSSGSMDLVDFVTDRITIFNDTTLTSNATASPVVVLATY